MSNRLYVGNLPYGATDAALDQAFSQVGAVRSARVITDRESGRSKGFGFVEMEGADEARRAVELLDGSTLDGRRLVVQEARPQEQRISGDGGGPRGDRYGGRIGDGRRY